MNLMNLQSQSCKTEQESNVFSQVTVVLLFPNVIFIPAMLSGITKYITFLPILCPVDFFKIPNPVSCPQVDAELPRGAPVASVNLLEMVSSNTQAWLPQHRENVFKNSVDLLPQKENSWSPCSICILHCYIDSGIFDTFCKMY